MDEDEQVHGYVFSPFYLESYAVGRSTYTIANYSINREALLNFSGVLVFVVSKILGDANPFITLNVYGHLFQERQDDGQRLEELIMPVSIEQRQPAPNQLD